MAWHPERTDADGGSAQAERPGRRAWRVGVTVAALILGVSGLAAAAAGVEGQLMTRRFTATQQRQLMSWETARRWRSRQAGRIFPATIKYTPPGGSAAAAVQVLTADRLGIARQASCAEGTSGSAGRTLARLGCLGVLRATYLDATQSLVVTVGVAILPSAAAASAARSDLRSDARHGNLLRPAAFPGTLAARFGDAQQQLTRAGTDGPYLVVSTVGYADGRPRLPHSSDGYADAAMNGIAADIADTVGAPLGAPPPVPTCPGAPGC